MCSYQCSDFTCNQKYIFTVLCFHFFWHQRSEYFTTHTQLWVNLWPCPSMGTRLETVSFPLVCCSHDMWMASEIVDRHYPTHSSPHQRWAQRPQGYHPEREQRPRCWCRIRDPKAESSWSRVHQWLLMSDQANFFSFLVSSRLFGSSVRVKFIAMQTAH